MSRVTNAILHYCLTEDMEDEKSKPAEVNRFFGEKNGFVHIDDPALPAGWYGGTKYMECELLIGAFNYLDLEGLISHLRSLSWKAPEDVQLMVKEQEDDRFRIINVFDPPTLPRPSGG